MQILNIHLISDFTCDTLMNISAIISTQFPNVKVNRILWPFVRYTDQVPEIIASVEKNPGVILFSILENQIEDMISEAAGNIAGCKIIPVIDYAISEVAELLNTKPTKIRRKTGLTDDYIQKMDALRYTLNHDDGKMMGDFEDAQIIIIGVSRTSKTPTSIYLANRGLRVVNIPFVSEDLMPKELRSCVAEKKIMVIGLAVDPDRLLYLRDSRLRFDGFDVQSSYNSINNIRDELRDFRRYCGRLGVEIIDVSSKSVEEVVANILRNYQKFLDNLV